MSEHHLPLAAPVLAGNEWDYVKECLDTGWVSSAGVFVERFERGVCEVTGARHAVAVVNGTAGLHMALLAAGVQPGERVIVPTLTFIATANAVRQAGAEPVFVDCDEYMNIDPEGVHSFLEEACVPGPDRTPIEKASGAAVRAVVPVHVYGRPADMASLMPVVEEHGLAVVEDACEALGSSWTRGPYAGRSTGTVGHGGVFSFNGNKIVTCGGGGMYVTDDAAAAARVRHLTTQAKIDAVRNIHDEAAWNYRLTNVAAAVGVAQLEQLEGFAAAKRANHQLYGDLLAHVPGIELLGGQDGTRWNAWFYSILIEESVFGRGREGLMQALSERHIETRPVWGLLHAQSPYLDCTAWRIERAGQFLRRTLNLPCSSDLRPADIERVVALIRDAGGDA